MCGLFAFHAKTKTISEQTLSAILKTLHHRGPDSQNYWLNESKTLALAHSRLGINDLRQINYPLSSPDGTIKLIFNGEFYDYKKIRNELTKAGHQFSTETDCEIAIHLYQEKGIHFLSQLRGEFAFIIWDQNLETLFAVRDRFGIKPLHYAMIEDTLYLGSEIPTLFEAGVPAIWNREAFYEYLHTNLGPERTLFENIHQVPAGNYLVFNKHGLRFYKYWDLDYPAISETHNASFAEYTERVQSKLIESVQLRMQADVPVAYYLSGGLDSSALLGIGAHLSSEPKHAFTICFNDEPYNEFSAAEATAKHVGANFHPLHLTNDDLASNFESVAKKAMVPMGNAAGIARYLLSRHVQQNGFKAVISGEGADEVFFGYNFLRLEALEDPNYKKTVGNVDDFIRKMNMQFPVDRDKLKRMPFGFNTIHQALGYIPRWLQTQTYLYATHRQLLSEEFIHKFHHYNPYATYLNALDVERQTANREPILKSLYCWIKAFFPNNLLSWVGDRMEMANSIEGRHPFLDHELFELSRQIPTPFKISGTVEKYILREAVKPFVMPSIAQKEKFMFQAPPLKISSHNALLGQCLDLINTYSGDLPFYNKKTIETYLNTLSTIDSNDRIKLADASSTLMSLASLAALQKTYKPT